LPRLFAHWNLRDFAWVAMSLSPDGRVLRAERRLSDGNLQIELPNAHVIGVARDAQTQK
jgi:hypothetical protein